MKVRFWGVRGSIASPGPGTVRYGGNTTCIEIRTDSNELIILDAGTAIFPLSQTLLGELPLTANVLLCTPTGTTFRACHFLSPTSLRATPCACTAPLTPFQAKEWSTSWRYSCNTAIFRCVSGDG